MNETKTGHRFFQVFSTMHTIALKPVTLLYSTGGEEAAPRNALSGGDDIATRDGLHSLEQKTKTQKGDCFRRSGPALATHGPALPSDRPRHAAGTLSRLSCCPSVLCWAARVGR